MDIKPLNRDFAVSPQIEISDIPAIVAQGYKVIICNRPDNEEPGQVAAEALREAAERQGLRFAYIPAFSGAISDANVAAMADALARLPTPVLAFCRSGARSTKLYELVSSRNPSVPDTRVHDVVIVGGGAAGIATASSLLKRNPKLDIAVIEPSEVHYYQPGWTMLGAGVFDKDFTRRTEAQVMPSRVTWIRAAASGFAPDENKVVLSDGSEVRYRVLVACPGIKLDWDAIPGLAETIGKNGMTSNYGYPHIT